MGGRGCRSFHSQMTQGPRNQLPVSPEREVEGESDRAQQGERKASELWLCGYGGTGLFVKIRNWEAGMNWRGDFLPLLDDV